MTPVRFTMFLVFAQLAVGSVWLLAWVPRNTIGVNFHRLMAVCAVVLQFFAVLSRYPGPDFRALLRTGVALSDPGPTAVEFWCVVGTLVAILAFMLVLVFGKSARAARVTGIAAGALGAVMFLVVAYDMRVLLATPAAVPLLAASLLLGAMSLGGVAVGMNLGHWYLMARLPLEPLQRVSTVLLGVLAAQAACTGLMLAFFQQPDLHDALITGLKIESFDGLFIWIRLLVGLAFPLMLAYMIRDTSRSGSTMSATGLLYIAILTVFVGEAASRFLLVTTGLWM